MNHDWLTPQQAGEMMQVSKATILRWIKTGAIPTEYVARINTRTIRIATVGLENLLVSNQT